MHGKNTFIMKNVLFIALLSLGLLSCNNTTSPKENADIFEAVDQVLNLMKNNVFIGDTITADGLGSLKLGAKIPDTIPGYDVTVLIFEDEEEMENVIVEVTKDDKLILQIQPGYVDETDAANDTIAGLLVISDQFATADGIRVGSNVQDILKKQGVTTYFNEKRFFIKDHGLTYIIKPEDYEGALPAVPLDSPVEVEQPTFKADAKVRAIGIFGE